MKNYEKILKLWLPLFIYMAFMWHVSSQSVLILTPSAFPFVDKILHIFEYTIFGFLLARAIISDRKRTKAFLFTTVIISAIIWGIIDEVHQSFVPMREGSITDLFADCFGAGLGLLFIQWNSIEKK